MKAEDEEKAKRRRQYLERSEEAAEKRRQIEEINMQRVKKMRLLMIIYRLLMYYRK